MQPVGEQTENCYSLAHGAGRKWTRTKASASLRQKYPSKSELEQTSLGSLVVCDDRDLLYEAAPEAYKEI